MVSGHIPDYRCLAGGCSAVAHMINARPAGHVLALVQHRVTESPAVQRRRTGQGMDRARQSPVGHT